MRILFFGFGADMLLNLEGVHTSYGNFPTLRGVTLSIEKGEIVTLLSGYNVYPREIEEILYQHPKIQEACIVGVPDPYRGETVKAFVVLKEKEEANAAEVIEFCQKNMAEYKVLTLVEFRRELPKLHVGKVLRKILREEELQSSELIPLKENQETTMPGMTPIPPSSFLSIPAESPPRITEGLIWGSSIAHTLKNVLGGIYVQDSDH